MGAVRRAALLLPLVLLAAACSSGGEPSATGGETIQAPSVPTETSTDESPLRLKLTRVAAGLDAQGRELERGILDDIAAAAGPDAVISWDMTIMGYWAAAHLPVVSPRTFLYPLGSGTLGYAWPAAIGAQAALPGTRTLGVVGDGGIHYGLTELASARQHELGAKLLIVDDGGYGILREYQRRSGDTETALVHYRAAAHRTTSLPEQRYLTTRAARLQSE